MVNSACLNVGPAAYGACGDASHTYCGVAGDLALALKPIVYTLFATGGIYAIDGVVKLTDLGVDSIAFCINQYAQKKLLFSDVGDAELLLNVAQIKDEDKAPPSKWKRTVSVWNAVSKTGKCFCLASLCLCVAYPLFRLIGILNAGCQSINGSCIGFKAGTISGCNWVNEFVIDLIKQLLQGNSNA
jgi:hypothetical protein